MKRRDTAAVVLGVLAVFAVSVPAHAKYLPLPPAKVFDGATTSTAKQVLSTFGRFDVGGANVALGELTGDGKLEIVLAEGLGKEPRVRVLTGDAKLLGTFLAYDKAFARGVNVAVGDFNNDNSREIVTTPGFGGGPHVRVWNRTGTELFNENGFSAYDRAFRGGLSVTAADVDGDGSDEIITGPGAGGGPHIRAFRPDGSLVMEFFAFEATMTQGVSVAGGDFNGDGRDELAVARQGAGESEVRVFRFTSGKPELAVAFSGSEPAYASGVELSAGDGSGDGKVDIIISQLVGTEVRAYTMGGVLLRSWQPYGPTQADAVRAVAGDVDGDARPELVAAPAPRTVAPSLVATAAADAASVSGKHIEVNLARQQLWAWENGRLAHTFLISSGTARFPSPTGTFAIFRKVPLMDYRWSYGPGNPNNYNLKNVPWNLNFKPRFYIHDAYWHNNFGVPMSHGCINVSLADSKWVYDWAELGTTVHIQ